MMKLRGIKQAISFLSPNERAKLDTWLHTLLEAKGSKKVALGTSKECRAQPAHRAANKTYRLEYVRCSKRNCKCAAGQLHGPYWYAYWSEGGRTRSQYVGKTLPDERKKARRKRV